MTKMPSILDEIVSQKRGELADQKRKVTQEALTRLISARPAPLDFAGTLSTGGVRLIAEVKKASPSRGLLCPDFAPVRIAETYALNGSAAISVLTDSHFQGELDHLSKVKESPVSGSLPILRKDFIFDPYQVYEARAAGADALLLIVAILSPGQLQELLSLTQQLGMQCLVEVHDHHELQTAVAAGAQVIGINNRDLRTFHTDLAVTEGLAPSVPQGKVIVSESGISAPEHLRRLDALGVNAVLVGEALVTAPDIGAKVRELTGQTVTG